LWNQVAPSLLIPPEVVFPIPADTDDGLPQLDAFTTQLSLAGQGVRFRTQGLSSCGFPAGRFQSLATQISAKNLDRDGGTIRGSLAFAGGQTLDLGEFLVFSQTDWTLHVNIVTQRIANSQLRTARCYAFVQIGPEREASGTFQVSAQDLSDIEIRVNVDAPCEAREWKLQLF